MLKIKMFFADLYTKVKSDVTNAVALVSTVLGSILAHIDDLATALGDPNLNQQLHTVFTDAKTLGKWMLTVGVVTAIARFKKLVETPKG